MNNTDINMTYTNNTGVLSLTEGSAKKQLEAIRAFQAIVKNQLVNNIDFGIIPGTGKKPTLLQPGAQKIGLLLGLSPKYTIINSTRDFNESFFDYQIKCELIDSNGIVRGESFGSANNREKGKSVMTDNTILKIAQKRALIGATLYVGSLSDVFTQDFDDMELTDLTGNKAEENTAEKQLEKSITHNQAKRIFALAGGNLEIVRQVLDKFNYKNSADVKSKDYEAICSLITKLNNPDTNSNDVKDDEADSWMEN